MGKLILLAIGSFCILAICRAEDANPKPQINYIERVHLRSVKSYDNSKKVLKKSVHKKTKKKKKKS